MVDLTNPIVDILCDEERPPTWLIPDLILQGSNVLLCGEAGAGKSYVSYTLGLAIAAGCAAFNGIVPAGEPKRVLYFDEENSEQDRNKYLRRAWKGLTKQNGKPPDLGRLLENFLPLSYVLGADEWADVVRFCIENFRPHLVVFDTANPCFNIDNENDNGMAQQIVREIKGLCRLTEPVASSIVLKHAKTRTDNGRRQVRGAKAWQGAADAVMFQVRAEGRRRRDGLALTRLEPDKTRAYGLQQTIYISPSWTGDDRHGLMLDASYSASRDHKKAEIEEEALFAKEEK